MNALRFWGGGYYEDDALFDLCDELGMCIWLDFKFGCTTYPAFDPASWRTSRQEARDNVRRLRHHPSIAVWCGNNEIMFFRGKDEWTKDKMSEADYYKLFRDTLGEAGPRTGAAGRITSPGSPDCGDVHFWEVWHGGKPFEVYRRYPRLRERIRLPVVRRSRKPWPPSPPGRTATSVYSPVMKYHERSNRMYMGVKEDGKHRHGQDHEAREEVFPRPEGL